MSTTYTDVFSGKTITAAFPQYSAIALTGDITLSWPAQFQNTNNVVSVLMDITPNLDGYDVTMPDATEGSTGFQFTVNNPGLYSFTLKTNTGTTIVTVPAGEASLIWLIDNDAAAGVWRNIPAFGGASAVTFVNASSDSNNLVITGVPITTGGTIAFSLQKDLLALTQFGASVGYAARTAANTWAVRSFLGTANQLIVTNPTGEVSNTSFALAPNISGVTSLALAGLSFGVIAANTIATTGGDVSLVLTANGTGEITLSNDTRLNTGKRLKFTASGSANYITFRAGATIVNQDLVWPTTAGGAGQVMIYDGAGSLNWGTVPSFPGTTTLNAVARYSNITGSLKDSPLFIVSDGGAITGPTSAQIGDIYISTIDSQTIATGGALDLIIAPTGLGALRAQCDVIVTSGGGVQKKLRLYNLAGNFYAGLQAVPGMLGTVTWTLPGTSAAGIFTTDLTNQISITPFTSYFPVGSTVNAVPRYSNITGYPLKDSLFVISDTGAGSGLISCTFGNISISTTANTIENTAANTDLSISTNGTGKILLKSTVSTNTNTNLTLSPNGTGIVTSTTDLSLLLAATQLKLRLYNSAGTFYTALQAGAAVANTTFTLPTAAILGYVKSDAAGNLSITADSTASTSTTTGALTVTGGIGIGLKAYIGGALNVTDATDSTSVSTGSGIFSGGIGLVKALVAGGAIKTTAITASTSPSTGALITSGGLGVAFNAYIGGNSVIGADIGGTAAVIQQALTLRGTAINPTLGPHIVTYCSGASSQYPVFQVLSWQHDSVSISFDAYYDGAWRSSTLTSNFQITKGPSELTFACGTSVAAGAPLAWTTAGYIDTGGLLQWQKSITIGTTSVAGGVKVLAIGNATTLPTSTPVGGGVLYVTGGALRYRGSSGTDVQIAAA
jgi:hypothetical protein